MHPALSRCQSAGIASALFRSVRIPRSSPLLRPALFASNSLVCPTTPRFFHLQQSLRRAVAAQAQETDTGTHGQLSRFVELGERGLAHPVIVETLTKQMGLENMTDVQAATVGKALAGVDMAAQAKTGTGKTLAFLVPILHRIIEENPSLAQRRRGATASIDDTKALIISPTRELAEQIAAEARRLTENTNVKVQVAVGGSSKRFALQEMRRLGCHILVATPGRLADLLSDEYSGVSLDNLNTLVLDEADRLLDQGFWPEIMKIERSLPKRSEQPRQTLLFSATMEKEVLQLARQILRPKHEFIKTINDNEAPTHERVPQKLVVAKGQENLMPALYELILRGIKEASNGGRPFKSIVFFNTTVEVELAANIFRNLRPQNGRSPIAPARIYEIHSQLTQAQRTRASEGFRGSESAVMFSSDVSARGMDFPNVTHVIQIRSPRETETYIHRVGRTGRAGKEGESWVLTVQSDDSLRNVLRKLPIKKDDSLGTAFIDMKQPAELPRNHAMILNDIGEASRAVDMRLKGAAYTVLVNIACTAYNPSGVLSELVDLTKYGWGLRFPPSLSASTISRLPRDIDPEIVSGARQGGPSFSDRLERPSRDSFGRGGRGGFGGSNRGARDFDRSNRGGRDFDRSDRGGYASRSGDSYGRPSRERSFGNRGSYGARSFDRRSDRRPDPQSDGFPRVERSESFQGRSRRFMENDDF